MSEIHPKIPLDDIIDVGNVRIHIASPEATMASIAEDGFDAVLVRRDYFPQELPGVIAARAELCAGLEDAPHLIHGSVHYLQDSISVQRGSLKHLYSLLREHYYEAEHLTLNWADKTIRIKLAPGVEVSIETVDHSFEEAEAFLTAEIDRQQPVRDHYADIKAFLEAWGAVQDVIAHTSPRGMRTSFTAPAEVVIDDYHRHLPRDPGDYDMWQKILASDPRSQLESSKVVPIDYEDVDFHNLQHHFGDFSQALVQRAMRQIVARKHEAGQYLGKTNPVSHLDIFYELDELRQE